MGPAAAAVYEPAATDRPLAVCADIGSTYTKLAVVDTSDGTLVATASHPTTVDSDVLDGLDAALAAVRRELPDADLSRIMAASSAGGGLRLAVVGYEPLVTAQAGHQVGLSAGARVVHVAAGPLDTDRGRALLASQPDVVLLVGGTDGGDVDVALHNARWLASSRLTAPVVVATNVDARDEATGSLTSRGKRAVPVANVLPRIGELRAGPARAAIRDLFLAHVIGGTRLSRGPRLASLVRGPTPDLVLTGVELLADGTDDIPGFGDVALVDVGGATTDVYSVTTPDAERSTVRRDVAGTAWRSRTVEGDLGVRWNAPGILAAATAERMIEPVEAERLTAAVRQRAATPGFLARTAAERAVDTRLAGLAVTVALRRHARPERTSAGVGSAVPRLAGKDLRGVRAVIGSGGVLRHTPDGQGQQLLATALDDHAGGWLLPDAAAMLVDTRYVLAAAGLLAAEHPGAGARLLRQYLTGDHATGQPRRSIAVSDIRRSRNTPGPTRRTAPQNHY